MQMHKMTKTTVVKRIPRKGASKGVHDKMANAPAVKRMLGKDVSKEIHDKLPPALQRVAKVNRDADKYKKIGK